MHLFAVGSMVKTTKTRDKENSANYELKQKIPVACTFPIWHLLQWERIKTTTDHNKLKQTASTCSIPVAFVAYLIDSLQVIQMIAFRNKFFFFLIKYSCSCNINLTSGGSYVTLIKSRTAYRVTKGGVFFINMYLKRYWKKRRLWHPRETCCFRYKSKQTTTTKNVFTIILDYHLFGKFYA